MRRWPSLLLAAGLIVGAPACTDDDGDDEAFCATAADLASGGGLAAELGALDLDDQAASGDALRAAATRLRTWAEDAESGVADDIEVLALAADAIAEAVAGGGPATLAPDARAELETIAADATAASERLVGDVSRRCSVDLAPPPPPDAATTTTAAG